MASAKRNIGQEILDGIRQIKRGEHGRMAAHGADRSGPAQSRLTVMAKEQASSLIDCAHRISHEDAREMRDIVDREFERVEPRDWK